MDRWRYVADAFRLLRPAGRLFIDNVDLESDLGWQTFAEGTPSSQHLERPPYVPRLSTAAELTTYAVRAGVEQVQTHRRPPLVIITAVKPSHLLIPLSFSTSFLYLPSPSPILTPSRWITPPPTQ